MQNTFCFTVNFDDKSIAQQIEKNAYNDAVNQVKEDINTKLLIQRNSWGYSGDGDVIIAITKHEMETFLEEHKDEIIESASKKLAEKIARSKQGKALIDNLMEKEG